ncbi:DUF5110 domain-containing protein [Olivibacter sp. 47]|uniref:DUF5110 domain-containing protein n=1 Tax=Olivibacter sp. 47 TaxID=3056486 RepID=UPI0025A4C57D|nr:DUF5110 domain-containing protein [Olivibacter sp. 47]MDM8175660.1 DUF5110 domain-containing protein [Olivibacter sp. 47]
MYEDDGLTYNYEKGGFNYIQIEYDDQTKTVTFSKRTGNYTAAPKSRMFNIVFVSKQRPSGIDSQAKPNTSVSYKGNSIKVKLTNN